MTRILSVSYDEVLLHTRRLLLESAGYSVTSAFGLKESLYHCRGGFDLFILGHSISESDKQLLIKEFHASCPSPIISLRRLTEPDIAGANYHIEPDPESVLNLVAEILGCARANPAQSATEPSEISSFKLPRNRA
jgi:hypothetical protein